jgi:hypothetical protein
VFGSWCGPLLGGGCRCSSVLRCWAAVGWWVVSGGPWLFVEAVGWLVVLGGPSLLLRRLGWWVASVGPGPGVRLVGLLLP